MNGKNITDKKTKIVQKNIIFFFRVRQKQKRSINTSNSRRRQKINKRNVERRPETREEEKKIAYKNFFLCFLCYWSVFIYIYLFSFFGCFSLLLEKYKNKKKHATHKKSHSDFVLNPIPVLTWLNLSYDYYSLWAARRASNSVYKQQQIVYTQRRLTHCVVLCVVCFSFFFTSLFLSLAPLSYIQFIAKLHIHVIRSYRHAIYLYALAHSAKEHINKTLNVSDMSVLYTRDWCTVLSVQYTYTAARAWARASAQTTQATSAHTWNSFRVCCYFPIHIEQLKYCWLFFLSQNYKWEEKV